MSGYEKSWRLRHVEQKGDAHKCQEYVWNLQICPSSGNEAKVESDEEVNNGFE